MLLFFVFSTSSAYQSEVVGEAAKNILTSRIVSAHIIFQAIHSGNGKPSYFLPLKGKALISATSNQIMEYLIVEEAKSFSLAELNTAKVKQAVSRFKQKLPSYNNLNRVWKNLEISDSELQKIAYTKLRADAFLKLKTESFSVRVNQEEIQAFIKERKLKNNKAEIKKARSELEAKKLQSAIREWFQILRSKYVAKNLLIKS